jgi:Flp pilus assembly protein TadG
VNQRPPTEPLRAARRRRSQGAQSGQSRQSGQVRQSGQAAVELALVFPFVAMLLLLLVQVGVIVRDQILVVHAAREGAREAAVEPAPGAARSAAVAGSGLDPDRLDVEVADRGPPGSRVRVTATYRAPTVVPIIGAAMKDIRLHASATMRVER